MVGQEPAAGQLVTPSHCEGRMMTHCATPAALPLARQVFPGQPDQVPAARRFVCSVVDSPAADDAALCTSELAANAVLHSASGRPGGQFTICAGMRPGGRARVEISDQGGPWGVPRQCDGQGGRGLMIVRELARAWGVEGDAGHGWTVWFEVGGSIEVPDITRRFPGWSVWISPSGRWWGARTTILTRNQAAAGCEPLVHAGDGEDLAAKIDGQEQLLATHPAVRLDSMPGRRAGLPA